MLNSAEFMTGQVEMCDETWEFDVRRHLGPEWSQRCPAKHHVLTILDQLRYKRC